MDVAITTEAGYVVPFTGAGSSVGGVTDPFSLPPATCHSRFGEAQLDLLGGQYQGMYTKQLVVPSIGASNLPHNHNLLAGAIKALVSPACGICTFGQKQRRKATS